MKTNAKDYVSAAEQFFTAYDAHDVDGMLALCADGALGRYAPYGRESVVPIRGGIDVIWRTFPNAVPNFRVKVIELIPAAGNTVVIQAEMSGPIPAEVPGVAKKGQDVHIPHCYILRFDADGKIARLDAYADDRWPAVIYLGITGKPEAIGSSHGFVTTNALAYSERSLFTRLDTTGLRRKHLSDRRLVGYYWMLGRIDTVFQIDLNVAQGTEVYDVAWN
jgi:hypothetical protein